MSGPYATATTDIRCRLHAPSALHIHRKHNGGSGACELPVPHGDRRAVNEVLERAVGKRHLHLGRAGLEREDANLAPSIVLAAQDGNVILVIRCHEEGVVRVQLLVLDLGHVTHEV